MTPLRINLEADDIPTHWYNISGQVEDYDYPAEAIVESLKHLPLVG